MREAAFSRFDALVIGSIRFCIVKLFRDGSGRRIPANDNYNVKNDGIITKFGVKNVIIKQKLVVIFDENQSKHCEI